MVDLLFVDVVIFLNFGFAFPYFFLFMFPLEFDLFQLIMLVIFQYFKSVLQLFYELILVLVRS